MASTENGNGNEHGNGNGKTVCVTGGSGYIASWLVKYLLQRGYFVRATVRDPGSSSKVAHLLDLPGASERLTLYEADLLDESSFDAPFHGCDGVFHTASPVNFNPTDPQVDLYDPAVRGTINVLNSCVKAKTVKRVVLTSSLVAVVFTPLLKPDDVADESCFSDVDYLTEAKLFYGVSKILAEKAAWEFAKESGLDLVTINPAMVVGPLLQPTINLSTDLILNLLTGGVATYGNRVLSWVDVRDVALAHIFAYETPTASGRYIVAEQDACYSQIIDLLKPLCPTCQFPTECEEAVSPLSRLFKISSEKVQSLGLTFTPLPESLKATVDSFKARGMLP